MIETRQLRAKPVAWSFSRIKRYRKCQLQSWFMDYCPKQFKVVEPPNPIFEKGKKWHKDMERSILGLAGLPPHLTALQPVADVIKNMPQVFVEKQMAFTVDLKPTGWFEDDVWCRVIWDAAGKDGKVLHLVDWKTGKPRPDEDQLELFAASGFRMFDDVEEVHTYFVFMEHQKYTHDVFKRSMEDHIWMKFGEEAEQIALSLENGNWEQNPGKHCDYCPVPQSKCPKSKVPG